MGRTVGDAALLLSAMASDDGRDPLATTIQGRKVRQPSDFSPPAAIDLAGLRVAITPDFGFAPTERHIAEVLAERTGLFRHVFARADDATPDCTGADEAFEVLRSLGYLTTHAENVRTRPADVGPNVTANVAEGLRYSAQDVARAMSQQTAIYRRWQAFFEGYDLILAPSITISPRPWTELYPAEIDGKPTRTYYHWLALAYAATLPGHPALSLPVGVDRSGMPFGLQIIGPRGGDALVLAAAAALEGRCWPAIPARRGLCRTWRTCAPRRRSGKRQDLWSGAKLPSPLRGGVGGGGLRPKRARCWRRPLPRLMRIETPTPSPSPQG